MQLTPCMGAALCSQLDLSAIAPLLSVCLLHRHPLTDALSLGVRMLVAMDAPVLHDRDQYP